VEIKLKYVPVCQISGNLFSIKVFKIDQIGEVFLKFLPTGWEQKSFFPNSTLFFNFWRNFDLKGRTLKIFGQLSQFGELPRLKGRSLLFLLLNSFGNFSPSPCYNLKKN
jgi:hypothetical protein